MPDGSLHPPAACGCDEEAGLLPPDAALDRLLRGASPVAGEEALPLAALRGRVLAREAASARDLPPFDQSAMDGYALGAPEGEGWRVVRLVAAGDAPGPALRPGEAARVLTGAALPDGAAAVVMEEHVALDGARVLPRRRVAPGDNMRRRGEDVARGQVLAAPGTRLDARHVALLAAAGITAATVRRRVRVALLSSGNELAGEAPAVHDSNRPMLRALLSACPALEVSDLGLERDDPAALATAFRRAAAGHDLVLSTGGICGSDADHVPDAIRAAGGTSATLRLGLKPGKPLAHGRLGGALWLGLPGNPLAALVTALLLARPLLDVLAGAAPRPTRGAPARWAEGFTRRPGREEFAPARVVGEDADGLPLLVRCGRGGSARLLPVSQADGLLRIPAAAARVEAGEGLRWHPFHACFGLG